MVRVVVFAQSMSDLLQPRDDVPRQGCIKGPRIRADKRNICRIRMRMTHASICYGCRMSVRPPRRIVRKRPIQAGALRGFEASGRLLSFTLAGAELNLTQSSISRQVAALERQVGKKLFARKTRALTLSGAGDRLPRAVRRPLARRDA